MGIKILGIDTYTPEKILTNHDLEKIMDTSDEWIVQRTGIKARHQAHETEAASDLGTKAAHNLLMKTGINPEEIDLILVSTLSPDMVFPSTACKIQNNIGAINSAAFDLSAACTGFIYGLTIAEQFLQTEKYKTILVISTEVMTKFLDWQDRGTSVLFGDGAGAMLLTYDDTENQILSTYIKADGKGFDHLNTPGGGSRNPTSVKTLDDRMHYLKMNGREVFRFSVMAFRDALEKGAELANIKIEDIDLIIPHQANYRIIESNAKRLNLNKEKVFLNLEKYGNTSSASIPLALHQALGEGRVKKGDTLAFVGFGGGYTWGSAFIKW